jgi:type IV pilus assembly protein PilM
MDLPWMPASDFKKALPYQVSDALPVAVTTVNLDFHPLGEYEISDEHGAITEMTRILLVAANMDVVNQFSRVLLKAGLRPFKADTIPFALIGLACGNKVGDPEAPVEAVVDLGADVLNIIVHQGGQPRFVRTISNYGGNIVTKSLMEKFNLTFDEAEKNKRRVGLSGPAPMLAAVSESSVFGGGAQTESRTYSVVDPFAQATLSVINPWMSSLVSEVRNSLDYFLSAYPNAVLNDVRVAGGGTYLEGLISRLNAELKVPVTSLDPFEICKVKKDSIREKYGENSCNLAVATGLAMKGAK